MDKRKPNAEKIATLTKGKSNTCSNTNSTTTAEKIATVATTGETRTKTSAGKSSISEGFPSYSFTKGKSNSSSNTNSTTTAEKIATVATTGETETKTSADKSTVWPQSNVIPRPPSYQTDAHGKRPVLGN